VSSKWKARANAHQQLMEKGDPFAYAEVYKGLKQVSVLIKCRGEPATAALDGAQ